MNNRLMTHSEVKQKMFENNNPNKNLVFSFNLTKEEVLDFVTEAIETLILLSNDRSLPSNIKNLTLQEIIDVCNGTNTESILSKEQIINKLEQLQLNKKEDKKKKLSIFDSLRERGIFKLLDFTAPIWEEVLFRSIPTIIAFVLISLPFSHLLMIPLSIIIFVLSQIQFVRSHIITDWLKTKDSGWLEELSTKGIFKISLLGTFTINS